MTKITFDQGNKEKGLTIKNYVNLNGLIEEVASALVYEFGVTVYVHPTAETWFNFTDGKEIYYFQVDSIGNKFTIDHEYKPSSDTGSCSQVAEGFIIGVFATAKLANQILTEKRRGPFLGTKYRDFEEFLSRSFFKDTGFVFEKNLTEESK